MQMLREKIQQILNLDQRSDVKRTEKGLLASHNPEIAPLAYQIKLNNPLAENEIDEILAFSREADPDAIRLLYGCFNGMNLAMSKFSVYGYLTELDRSDFLTIQNVPYDIEVLQTYDRPEYAPQNGCVVATSDKRISGSKKYFHVITPEGTVQIGEFEYSPNIVSTFKTVEDWLVSQVKSVLNETEI